jgi:hypothetical protein
MENSGPPVMYLETIKSEADDYIKNVVDRSIAYYRRHGLRNNILYNGARILLIVLSLSLLSLSAIPKDSAPGLLSVLSTALPLAIAVIAALDGFFHWGDIWRSRVHTQLSLGRLKREFHADWLQLSVPGTDDLDKKAYEIYRMLVNSVETTMVEEEELFWGRRILEQRERKENSK